MIRETELAARLTFFYVKAFPNFIQYEKVWYSFIVDQIQKGGAFCPLLELLAPIIFHFFCQLEMTPHTVQYKGNYYGMIL